MKVCIVHGRIPYGPRGQQNDGYHIHHTGMLSGMHFDQINIVDAGDIPTEAWPRLLGWLPTRLRPGGTVTIKWGAQ